MINNQTTVERKSAIKNSVGRIAIVCLLLLAQLLLFIFLLADLYERYPIVAPLTSAIAVCIVLGINSRDNVAAIKLVWIILILTIPIPGVVLYLINILSGSERISKRRYIRMNRNVFENTKQDDAIINEISSLNENVSSQFSYFYNFGSFPVYGNTDVKYFAWAKDGIASQIEDMKKAKKFIFFEYHAIENKESFEPILNVLKQKVDEGVDVRVIYDDIGSFVFINKDFKKMLESYGIKCRVFNPMVPVLEIFMNHRDHRKITVIDGQIGYTGGYNIANEYFNVTRPYGQWKDTGIRLDGDAVKSLTALFLEMWDFAGYNKEPEDVSEFLNAIPESKETNGYICPFGDSPLDDEPVGENAYIFALNNSKKYCWFSTPYLVISDELKRAMYLAAKRGVDVRIITPGIPDKKTVYQLTRSYYSPLVSNGIKIYEYTPGFNHCKMCISDSETAIIGTINLDFRSLYHHFENAAFIYKSSIIDDMKADFDEIINDSNEVTEKYKNNKNIFLFVGNSILRLVAPLL